MRQSQQRQTVNKRRRRSKLPLLIFIVMLGILIPFAYVGWAELYSGFVETNRPRIVIIDPPKGIGRLPVTINVKLIDDHAGLDEVVVRTTQNKKSEVLLREKLGGQKERTIKLEFPGEDSSLEPGTAIISIRAFDRSFWSNTAEQLLPLSVDYQKPTVDVVSTQHNVNHGGAQLAFYNAFDESPMLSGIKVEPHTFPGMSARGIDPEFRTHENLYMAFYTVDIHTDRSKAAVRVFAEDAVGNATSKQFFNRIRPATVRKVNRKLTQEFLRNQIAEIAHLNQTRMTSIAKEINLDIAPKTKKGSQARLLEQFNLVNSFLREVDNNDIIKRLQAAPRFESFLSGSFDRVGGTITSRFGDHITYLFNEQPVAEQILTGHVYRMQPEADVFAVADGIVAFTDNLGMYGKIIGIDHGLGISTIYSSLGTIEISAGERVETGDLLGTIGQSGLYRDNQLYFEVRVHGIPVNPREWFDPTWYNAQITSKVVAMKRQLGIPLY
jgi:murein DD-endopeptidase MepM/ murein hydrolase activator NlpD